MPIKLPATLPAYKTLAAEGVMVMDEDQAARQDIRPLRIALLNLMPKKIETEIQFTRLIGATPLQIDLSLIRMSEHQTRNTSAAHMDSFYRPFSQVAVSGDKFDGLIITGAPIEHLPFSQARRLNICRFHRLVTGVSCSRCLIGPSRMCNQFVVSVGGGWR